MPLLFLLAWLAMTVLWWGLALAPLPATPPAWLVVARQVCFGATATGLPEGYGWLGLFAVPGFMLAFLLVVWGKELHRALRAMRATWYGPLVCGLLVAVPGLGTYWVGQRVLTALPTAQTLPQSGTPLPHDWPRLDRPAPAFSLLDQDGKPTSLAAHRGEIIVLTFAFGHCTTLCPTVVHTARAALAALPDLTPHLWVITLDPWRDTPSALPGLVTHWQLAGERSRVLSADVAAVLAVLDAYHVPHQRDAQSGDIRHPALVYLIDAAGCLVYGLTNPSQEWLRDAIQRLAHTDVSSCV